MNCPKKMINAGAKGPRYVLSDVTVKCSSMALAAGFSVRILQGLQKYNSKQNQISKRRALVDFLGTAR
jgi:hypothetical protein